MQEEQHEGPYPRTPRPGSRTFSVTTAGYEITRLARVGLDVSEVIEGEIDDFRAGLKGAEDPAAYAAGQDDLAIWEGPRLMAVILPRAGDEPEVYRFDEGQPRPATEAEREAWSIVGELGADEAIDRLTRPEPPPPPPPLSKAERSVLFFMKELNATEDEVMLRLTLGGHYQVIHDACRRLGSDAVGELIGIVATGKRDRVVIARAAEALAGIDLVGLEEVAGQLRAFNDREADRVVRAWKAIDSARATLAEAG